MKKSDRHAVENEFFINAEKILFMTIIGLMERKAIRTNLLGEGEFIDKLVLINDKRMQSYMRTFNQLSPILKQSIITGLRIRLQDYVNKED